MIRKSGSYVLANRLTGAGNCIVLATDNVTLDLDGQTISGDGTGFGIGDDGETRQNIVIRNGTIRNFETGISLLSSSHITVERMHVLRNTDNGIVTGLQSIIRDNIVTDNGDSGIVAFGAGSLISGNIANDNNGWGISANCPSNVIGNMASGNINASQINAGGNCSRYHNNPAP
jgi:parallel beta-helix repeat protein